MPGLLNCRNTFASCKLAQKLLCGLWAIKREAGFAAKGTIGKEPMSLPFAAGSLCCCKPPQWVQGRALVGVKGAKPPEELKILHFTVPR